MHPRTLIRQPEQPEKASRHRKQVATRSICGKQRKKHSPNDRHIDGNLPVDAQTPLEENVGLGWSWADP